MGKKDSYYFSHDSNARSDPKMIAMMDKYGLEGYGKYWVIVENLRDEADHRLPKKNYMFTALAVQMQCERNAVEEYVSDCINEYELFESDDDFFWSNSLLKRMNLKEEKREKAKKAAQKRWEKANEDKGLKNNKENEVCERNADAMQMQCEPNAIKGKERKRKEILKENKSSLEEIKSVSDFQLEPELKTEFENIKNLYPRKDDFKNAYAEFKKKVIISGKVNQKIVGEIISGIEDHRESDSWKSEDGRFIPLLTSYLNGERWKDQGFVKPKVVTIWHKQGYDDYVSKNKELINQGKLIVKYNPKAKGA